MDQGVQHAAPAPSSWMEIFRGRLLVYTVLLNFGILFFGIDGFVVNTLMPTIVADIGGLAYYARNLHWNRRGHGIVARGLVRFLADQ